MFKPGFMTTTQLQEVRKALGVLVDDEVLDLLKQLGPSGSIRIFPDGSGRILGAGVREFGGHFLYARPITAIKSLLKPDHTAEIERLQGQIDKLRAEMGDYGDE